MMEGLLEQSNLDFVSERMIKHSEKFYLRLSFFNICNWQPRGYISEGQWTIDNQSEQAATLYMITNQSNSIGTITKIWAQPRLSRRMT